MGNRERSIEQYKSLMTAFADPCEGVIYHYTSANGLRGIVENHEIWLTNTVFVNDMTECRALQNEKDMFGHNELVNKYVRKRWDWVGKHPDTSNNTYIASFSRSEESLDQWRAYGSFRIGFEAGQLAKRRFNLYECVYDKQQIKNWILEKEKVEEWEDGFLEAQYKIGAAFNLIYAASKKYKNVNFAAEKEVRLIAVSNHNWEPYADCPGMFEDDQPIHFRDHAVFGTPIPYIKFFVSKEEAQRNRHEGVSETASQMKARKLQEEREVEKALLPIKEVLIGPMLHQEEARIACEVLLREKGYENVKVTASDIPYRGF